MQQELTSRVQQTIISSQYKIKFDDIIKEPFYYDYELGVLESATVNDTVVIIIATDGGNADTLVMIIDYMKKCQAPIHGIVMGNAHSAGSFIALNCDSLEVAEGSGMMIHTVQSGYGGDTKKIITHANHLHQRAEFLVRSTYEGFLSEDEMLKVLDGNEYWFNTEEIRERWDNRQEHLASQIPAITQEERDTYLPMVAEQFIEQAAALEMSTQELFDYINSTVILDDPAETFVEVLDINEMNIDQLKLLATNMDIKFPHNIGIDKLREKVLAKVE